MLPVEMMKTAARELAEDDVLNDPSDDTILIAAAELAGVETDLAKLSRAHRFAITEAYDHVNRLRALGD